MSTDNKRLFLLDAFALIYRAYFAFSKRPLINSKGFNVSAITGFLNTLHDLLKNEKPTHLAVAFDPEGPTNRAKEFSFYKANREEMPEDIRAALPYIEKILAALQIPVLKVEGFEADDVVGTIAKQAEKDDFQVFMVTSDKDYAQLVSDNIFWYKPPHLSKPKEILGVAEVLEKWDIERTEQVIDFLGMMGDAVDNIPGIKGVGRRTASKLLKKFDSMENMFENVQQITGKLKDKVIAGKESGRISKKLATIICDVPIEYNPESYLLTDWDKEALTKLFVELEFRNLGKRFLGEEYTVTQQNTKKPVVPDLFNQHIVATTPPVKQGKNIENTPHTYELCDTVEKRKELLTKLLAQSKVCFDTETSALDANKAELVGIAFSFESTKAFYVPIPDNQEEAKTIIQEFVPFFENEEITKVGQNLKYDILVLKWYDITVKGKIEDTLLAHYVLVPNMRHNLTILSETYLQYTPVSIESLIGKKGKKQKSMRTVPIEKIKEYAGEDADLTWQIHQHFEPMLANKQAIKKLYEEVETPLVPVLAEMEYNGVNLDVDFLKGYAKEITAEISAIKQTIIKEVGVDFNLDSPLQLGKILFDRLKIPYEGKKTKTGRYSTNEAILSKLALKHDIAAKIMNYRELTKLLNTYVAALPKLVNPKSNRIHSSFNQAITATGRLSSTDPNLQNIPIRTERGRKIRKAFIPRNENFVLLAADYSQIELRLMAAFSEDENMVKDFQDGIDIHTATAARVYKVALEEVDKEMRRKAKRVNFGIIYGITAFGLSQRLDISTSEAKEIIDAYFSQYQGVEKYMTAAVEKVKQTNYAETILGRRRLLNDIHSRNRTVRQFAERNAVNAPIQGSAADMIKVAMINIHQALKDKNLQSKMVLQVHDELVFDVYKPELEEVKALVIDNMQNTISLAVPIKVEVGIGENWLEAH